MGAAEAKAAILANKTALGIEFGSTRIKAVLVDDKNQPIASARPYGPNIKDRVDKPWKKKFYLKNV